MEKRGWWLVLGRGVGKLENNGWRRGKEHGKEGLEDVSWRWEGMVVIQGVVKEEGLKRKKRWRRIKLRGHKT